MRPAVLLATGAVLAALLATGTAPAVAGPVGGAVLSADVTPRIKRVTKRKPTWSARLVARSRATSKPGGKGRIVARLGVSTSWSHQPQRLLVTKSRKVRGREWLKVVLPVRPTGIRGWIARDRVILRRNRFWLAVRKKNRRLIVFRNGKRVRRFRVVIGKAATPTPAGLAAVYERNRQPDPKDFLGPWALPITALSRTLRNYGGGPGRVALHGRGGASYNDPLGSAASHGCVRMPNRGIRWLASRVGPGTPVMIRN